ncbi:hypothetical protein V1358_08085 [Pseudoalteromonas sp. YIC-656]|uniref:hypothetical protein n=1 Tax=Pseudoalteromonas pernae TaxID=3118054 RepID=UPI0032426D87
MKECILHIGMHKTGSSAIQEYCTDNSGSLGDGIVYADLGTANHSGPICYAYKSEIETHPYFNRRGHSTEEFQRLRELYQSKIEEQLAKNYHKIIFSAEDLVALTKVDLDALKSVILRYVDKISVVAYLRSPIDFAESAFQEMVKAYPVEPEAAVIFPKYESSMAKFCDQFSDVSFYYYDKSAFPNGSVVQDFCKRVGIKIAEESPKNVSLSGLAVKFLYRYQSKRVKVTISHEQTQLLESILAPLQSGKFRLNENVIEEALVLNQSEHEWAAKQLDMSVDEFINRQQRPEQTFSLAEFTEQEVEKIMSLPRVIELAQLVQSECGVSLPSFLSNIVVDEEETKPDLLKYSLDRLTPELISGWVVNLTNLDEKVLVQLYVGDTLLEQQKSDKFRADLQSKSVGDGFVSFRFDLASQPVDINEVKVCIGGKVVN